MAKVSLKEHLEALIDGVDRRFTEVIADRDVRIQIALAAAKEAVDKAEKADDKRFTLLNEFRGQAADESKKYALRENVEQSLAAINERVNRAQNAVSTLQGRALALAGFGALLGTAIGFFFGSS